MALDPTRAQLVSSAYRYKTIDDASIKAQYPNAREIVIDTSLDETSAGYLAQETFNSTKNASRTYEVVVRDRVMLDDFLDGAPRYKVDFGSRHPAALAMGLDLTIFDSAGVTEHPTDFAGLKARTTYATPFNKAIAPNINTGFGEYALPNNGDQFASLFTGFVSIDTEGTWEFGVDGDDAVSVEIDGTVVAGWYDGHGASGDYGAGHRGSIYLTKGLHRLTFRHEEINGGNSAVLGYRSPAMIAAGSPMAIAPPKLFRRPTNPTFTVIAATTRLRAGTTTLTVRA